MTTLMKTITTMPANNSQILSTLLKGQHRNIVPLTLHSKSSKISSIESWGALQYQQCAIKYSQCITFTFYETIFNYISSPPLTSGLAASVPSPYCNLEGSAIVGESAQKLSSAVAPGVRGVSTPALPLILPTEAPLPLQQG